MERRGFLEAYVGESSQLPNILGRFDSYLSGVRTGSEHTRRAYSNNVYEYLRYMLFEKCQLPKDYFEIGFHVALLHHLDLKDQGLIEDAKGIAETDSEIRALIPYERKISGNKLEAARRLLGPDFNFSFNEDGFSMQLKRTGVVKKVVELKDRDVLMIDFLCSVYDPGAPEYRRDDRVCMDRRFWASLFRRDRLGEFQNYLRQKKNKNCESTINRKLAALSTFVGFLILNEKLLIPEDDPFYRKKRPVSEHAPQLFLEKEQIDRIYSKINRKCKRKDKQSYSGKRDRALFSISTGTLIRASANCNLRLEDIDFDNRTIRVVEKGKKKRVFHLTKRPWKDLRDWLEVRKKYLESNHIDDNARCNGYVYVTERGNPMHYRCWHRILGEYAEEAGVKVNGGVSPHDLRRSVAKQMNKNGADIFQLQKILGHKNIQTTVTYLDILGIDEQEVIQRFNPFA